MYILISIVYPRPRKVKILPDNSDGIIVSWRSVVYDSNVKYDAKITICKVNESKTDHRLESCKIHYFGIVRQAYNEKIYLRITNLPYHTRISLMVAHKPCVFQAYSENSELLYFDTSINSSYIYAVPF
ncbi:hypothetical protein RF11_12417 [Thelohanellus kitauei]|uniref:Uncharacterized protein n=1 Tax=Thelohanellus kitauei TaxID=669202 RepID=A0A0C2M6Q0_THEKT|nr:hypothetical protein RF11_12417 [Thelohanellus kitauei]